MKYFSTSIQSACSQRKQINIGFRTTCALGERTYQTIILENLSSPSHYTYITRVSESSTDPKVSYNTFPMETFSHREFLPKKGTIKKKKKKTQPPLCFGKIRSFNEVLNEGKKQPFKFFKTKFTLNQYARSD